MLRSQRNVAEVAGLLRLPGENRRPRLDLQQEHVGRLAPLGAVNGRERDGAGLVVLAEQGADGRLDLGGAVAASQDGGQAGCSVHHGVDHVLDAVHAFEAQQLPRLPALHAAGQVGDRAAGAGGPHHADELLAHGPTADDRPPLPRDQPQGQRDGRRVGRRQHQIARPGQVERLVERHVVGDLALGVTLVGLDVADVLLRQSDVRLGAAEGEGEGQARGGRVFDVAHPLPQPGHALGVGTSPRIDGLEGVAHGHDAAPACQERDEGVLHGIPVLHLVEEQHVTGGELDAVQGRQPDHVVEVADLDPLGRALQDVLRPRHDERLVPVGVDVVVIHQLAQFRPGGLAGVLVLRRPDEHGDALAEVALEVLAGRRLVEDQEALELLHAQPEGAAQGGVAETVDGADLDAARAVGLELVGG